MVAKGIRFLVVGVATFGALIATPASAFQTLDPGGPPHLTETVPVQIVVLGYEPDRLPSEPLLAALPAKSKPIVRYRNYRGVREELGLDLTYDYKVVYTDAAYEDAFFGYLASIAIPETAVTGYDESFFQYLYNIQQKNVVQVVGNVIIDATAVERWLIEHPAPGIDPDRNTLVLVNWWGRPDFTFHTYRKVPNEPDLDTGVDIGLFEESRTIAWGGTGPHDEETGFGRESRLWFHDLSAGPDWRTGNWLIDTNVGYPISSSDHYLPPIWEYLTPGGFRAETELAGDLAKVARYVAIDLLFTSSPIFPNYVRDDRLPADIGLDLTTFDDLGNSSIHLQHVVEEIGELLDAAPQADAVLKPLNGQTRSCYLHWLVSSYPENSCYAELKYYGTNADLFLTSAKALKQWRDGSAEYEAGGFIYNADVVNNRALGIAFDNFLDGTQSGIYVFDTPALRAIGFGATTTVIHEYGHHFGLSHPHDGYDAEDDLDFNPQGDTYFAWAGDEVNSVMSYVQANTDFSQFELDNHRRWSAAASLRSANAIAGKVLMSPNAAAGISLLATADSAFGASQNAMTHHDYKTAAAQARAGYDLVRQAAEAAGVVVTGNDNGWVTIKPGFRAGAKKLFKGTVDLAEERAGFFKPSAELLERRVGDFGR